MQRRRMRWLSIGVAATAFAVSLALFARLDLGEDVTALLPDADPIVRDYRFVVESFRALDALYIDVGAQSDQDAAEHVPAVADVLHDRLSGSPLFSDIHYRVSPERWLDFLASFSTQSAGLLSGRDLADIQERITQEAVSQRLDAARRALLDPSGPFMARQIRRDPLGFDELLIEKFAHLGKGNTAEILDGRIWSADRKHVLMIAAPRSAAMDTREGVKLVAFVDESIRHALKAAPQGAVRISYIGGHRAALDNSQTIKSDTAFTLTAVSLGILALGILFFRRKIFIALTFLPALFGLVCASGLIALFSRHISAISIGCGAVLVGIAVDYGIHILFHLDNSNDERFTPQDCVRALRMPLAMGSLTTAGALLCLLLSSLPGQRQMGLFSALGVLGAVLFAGLVLPHIIRKPRKPAMRPVVPLERCCSSLLAWIARRRTVLALCWLAVLGLSLFGLKKLRFEGDVERLNYLRPPTSEDQERVRSVWGDFSETAVVVRGKTLEDALQANDALLLVFQQLADEGAVESYSSISPLFPSSRTQEQNARRWRQFWSEERRAALKARMARAGTPYKFTADAFQPFFERLEQPASALALETFNRTGLEKALQARMAGAQGEHLILSNFVCDLTALDHAAQAIHSGLPDAIVMNGRRFVEHTTLLVRSELRTLAAAAFIVMTVCLFLFLARIELVLAALIPVCFSVLLTLGMLGLLGIPINLMNCLFIVFVFGVGVDFSIFLLSTALAAYRGRGAYAATTCGSVVICALTTMCGFTALSFATHPALFSVGITGLIGMASSLSAALTLVPLITGSLLPNEGRHGTPSLKTWGGAVWAFIYLAGLAVIYLYCFRFLVWLWYARRPVARRRLMRKYNRLVAAGLLKFFPYLDSERIYINAAPAAFQKPAIIVSNHRSAFDIMVILALPVEMVMLVKGWVWNAPLVGPIAREAGFVLVGEDDPEEVYEHCRERLEEGASLMFFPEGSRSPDGRVRRFHKGAFDLAKRIGADVIPVHLSNTEACIPRKATWIGDHRSVIRVLPRITGATCDDGRDAKVFARDVRDQLRACEHADWRLAQNGKAFWHNVRTLYNYRGAYAEAYVAWKLRLDPIYHGIDELVPEQGDVLDLGCGYGLMAAILARKSRRRRVLGVDMDERKLALAQRIALALDNLSFELRNFIEWPYPEADAVLLTDVLHYWPRQRQHAVIASAAACLRPGGTLIFREALASQLWRHRLTAWTEVFATRIGHNRCLERLCFCDRDFYVSAFEDHGLTIRSERPDLGRGSNLVLVLRKEK